MFHDHPDKVIEINREQVEYRGFLSNQDQPLLAGGCSGCLQAQVPQDSAEDILDVEDSLLEERIGQPLKRRDILVESSCQGRFRAVKPAARQPARSRSTVLSWRIMS